MLEVCFGAGVLLYDGLVAIHIAAGDNTFVQYFCARSLRTLAYV